MKQAGWFNCRYAIATATNTTGYHHHHCYYYLPPPLPLSRWVLPRVGGPGFLQRLFFTQFGYWARWGGGVKRDQYTTCSFFSSNSSKIEISETYFFDTFIT